MRSLIKTLAPDRFEDMMALVALYRPGPLNQGMHTEYAERKHARRKVTYPHPDLEEILSTTYGVMVYQEQIMQIAVRTAGYSMGQADDLRRVMAKKKRELIGMEREKFVAGCLRAGHTDRLAKELFDLIEPFADYGFPAAHACAYGYVAYQTAYLKAHHPVEFMSAMLTSVKDDKDRKPFYLNACRLMGIEVLPPDVNESENDFAPAKGLEPGDPLRAVGGAQRGGGRRRTDHRRAPRQGRVRLVRRLLPQGRAVGAHEARAGEPDLRGSVRLAGLRAPRADREPGQGLGSDPRPSARRRPPGSSRCSAGDSGVTEVDESVLDGEEFDKRTLLREEKEVLGQFVTDHPLLGVQELLAAQTTHEIGDLESLGDGDLVTIGGIIGARAAQVHEAERAVRAVPAGGARRRRRRSWRSHRSTRPCPG